MSFQLTPRGFLEGHIPLEPGETGLYWAILGSTSQANSRRRVPPPAISPTHLSLKSGLRVFFCTLVFLLVLRLRSGSSTRDT